MAIGRPASLTSNVASKSVSATATAGQTLFTVSGGYRKQIRLLLLMVQDL